MPLPGSLDDQYIQALRDIADAVRTNTQAITEFTELFKQTIQEPPVGKDFITPPKLKKDLHWESPETPKLKKMPSPDNPFDNQEDDDFFPRGPKVRM